MTEKLIRPIVNINGTARSELIERRLDVMQSLRTLQNAFTALRPHGRDYLGDTDRFKADTAIYEERFSYLHALHEDLENEAIAIQNEGE